MQKTYFYIIILMTLQFFTSCNDRFGEVMEMAGENRSELINVLEHYKEDSLKSKAAMFLIENMYHYSLKDSGVIYDAHHITADYLIRDIDLAFDCWEHSAWKKEVDFDTFCRFILPYRVNNEPLSSWRDTLRNEYRHLVVGIDNPIKAFETVYSTIIKQFKKLGKPEHFSLDAMTLHHLQRGTCDQRSVYIVSVMRSLGIPATYDYVPFWGNYSTSNHAWASYVNNNKTYTVYGNDTIAKEFNRIDGEGFNDEGLFEHPHHQWDSVKRAPAIFRISYERVLSLKLVLAKNIPNELKEPFTTNVSKQYGYTHRVEIPSTQTNNSYLHAFKTGQGWRAVLKGLSRDEQIVFENLPGKMLYLPVRCYNDAKRLPIGHPFILDAGGQVHNLKPNQQNLHSITVWRKYPLRKQWYNRWKLMLGSTIEVSDDSLFLNKKIVYTFNSPTESIFNIPIELDKSYRYIRLQTDLNKRPEIAEFKIFSKNEKKQLIGDIIYHRISEQTVGQVFDDNYLTYAPEILRGYWIGLDLGEANTDTIGSIEICPRHDMNMIKQGDEYELFYYDMAWKSLGKKIATTDSLVFENVPSNALLWLRNHTGGMEERPFTYENGKQVWW